ncbi:delta-60 repeat domain-containing protein [Lysobacter sp. CA199]|uniref:delta-60 repeat domain-containing protein n=1 Tax=Lysobacter sp. CA199 TaxID=3455608 RepID=UPI003F8D2416
MENSVADAMNRRSKTHPRSGRPEPAMVLQPDGRFIVARTLLYQPDFAALVRYLPNGKIDQTFLQNDFAMSVDPPPIAGDLSGRPYAKQQPSFQMATRCVRNRCCRSDSPP